MSRCQEQASWTYRVAARSIGALGCLPMSRFSASGLDNLADDGAQILAFTHHNSWDIPALGTAVWRHNRRPVHFMAKEELLGVTAIGPLLKSMHGLPINRYTPSTDQKRKAEAVVASGHLLGMAPEGGRRNGKEIGPLMGGVGSIAVKYNAEVIPVGIAGRDIRRPIGPFLPRTMHVHFGEPILAPDSDANFKQRRLEVDNRLRPALQEAFDIARSLHPVDLD